MAKKDKKKNQDNLSRLHTGKIKINVYRTIGGNTPVLMGEFFAQETRDEYNNLVAINNDALFNEDIDFNVDDVYVNMNVLLNLESMTKSDKIKVLSRKISEQDLLLKCLEAYPKLNCVFNYCDEKLKREDYTLLREHLEKLDEDGSFYTIEQGVRVFSYHSCDSMFIPVWHGMTLHTQYPDHTRKKKINIQEEYTFLKEIKAFNKEKFASNVLVFASVIVGLLLIIASVGAYKGWQYSHETQDAVNQNALACGQEQTACFNNINKILENSIIKEVLEKKMLENNITMPDNKTIKTPTEIAIKVLNPK
jgi:hypothetical protein